MLRMTGLHSHRHRNCRPSHHVLLSLHLASTYIHVSFWVPHWASLVECRGAPPLTTYCHVLCLPMPQCLAHHHYTCVVLVPVLWVGWSVICHEILKTGISVFFGFPEFLRIFEVSGKYFFWYICQISHECGKCCCSLFVNVDRCGSWDPWFEIDHRKSKFA